MICLRRPRGLHLACGGRRARNAGTHVPRGGTESSSRGWGRKALRPEPGLKRPSVRLLIGDFLRLNTVLRGDVQDVEVFGINDRARKSISITVAVDLS